MLVSIVMPVFNGARFLRDAIDSVLAQTCQSFELVIVDDGSTDESREIVGSLARTDPRVTVLWQDHKGIVAARTAGILAARAGLVAMMDCDDRMHPGRLARQLKYMAECPELAVCCTWANLIDAQGKKIGYSNHRVDVAEGKRTLNPSRFLEIVNPSTLFRKLAFLSVGGYRDVCPAEDRDLWGRLVTHGYQIACIEEYLLDYRLHGSTTTVRKQNLSLGHFIDLNVVRRLQGQEELSLDAYWCMRSSLPLSKRTVLWCEEVSMANYKRAVREYGEGRLSKCAITAARACALRPRWALGRACSALWSQSGDRVLRRAPIS